MTVDETIGRNVHHLMWDRRVRHRELYEAMGLSRSALAKKMRGETVWLARDIQTAADVLDVEPGRLFEGATMPSPRVTGGYYAMALAA